MQIRQDLFDDESFQVIISLSLALSFLTDNSVNTQGTWGPWTDWSPCPALCGQVGVQLRSRNCQSRSMPCNGPKVEGKSCNGPECPKTGEVALVYQTDPSSAILFLFSQALTQLIRHVRLSIHKMAILILFSLSLDCSLQCVMGRVNAECDACMCKEHILLGSVRGAGGLTAEGATILRSGKLLTLTDHNGHFRIPGICPDGNTTLTVRLQGHATLSVTVPHSAERTPVLSVQLKRTGTPKYLIAVHVTFVIKK